MGGSSLDDFRLDAKSTSQLRPFPAARERSARTRTLPNVKTRALAAALLVFLCGGSVSTSTTSGLVAARIQSPSASPVVNNPPIFDDSRFYYRGDDNDPAVHPVPPEVQTGPKRDWHIRCIDWYRLPRSGAGQWKYFVTTCECWSSATLEHFAPKKQAPGPSATTPPE